MQVVWFKRDLRVRDHAPLVEAASRGPCLCLYVYEPELLDAEEFDRSHLEFINESLRELDAALRELGGRLTLRHGDIPTILDELQTSTPISHLWSHQETGNAQSFARDKRVAAWAKANSIRWSELKQHGVSRPQRSRDGWAQRWRAQMTVPALSPPTRLLPVEGVEHGLILSAAELRVRGEDREERRRGGESLALDTLRSFLRERGVNYRADMSSPLHGWNGCSRLSPYLAWGNLSIRQVFQQTQRRVEEIQTGKRTGTEVDPRWAPSLRAFEKRLRWHCHFIQKLEDEPAIEFENMNRAYDGLREDEFDEARFEAWCAGQTGYPLIDACMRALDRGGWINFRMRAMLVSFASYHLWLHWRRPALHLAQRFLDFEPGIHFSQVQMQAGVTGINAVRIYSPIKQVHDQDPEGVFIKRYCPELAQVPASFIAEPHKMPPSVQRQAGCIIGTNYPAPVVEHSTAYRLARERMYRVKGSASARAEAAKVYVKHGSRRRPPQRRHRRDARTPATP